MTEQSLTDLESECLALLGNMVENLERLRIRCRRVENGDQLIASIMCSLLPPLMGLVSPELRKSTWIISQVFVEALADEVFEDVEDTKDFFDKSSQEKPE